MEKHYDSLLCLPRVRYFKILATDKLIQKIQAAHKFDECKNNNLTNNTATYPQASLQ